MSFPHELGFSLGSNLGDRVANLALARRRILECGDARELGRSPLYETEPVGVKPEYQHLKFINAVLVIESRQSPRDWLAHIARLETELGRSRDVSDRFAPRDIDIDLIFAGGAMIDSGGLTVPHQRWAVRRFVVQPLADVRPGLVLPGDRRTVSEVLASLPGAEELQRLDQDW